MIGTTNKEQAGILDFMLDLPNFPDGENFQLVQKAVNRELSGGYKKWESWQSETQTATEKLDRMSAVDEFDFWMGNAKTMWDAGSHLPLESSERVRFVHGFNMYLKYAAEIFGRRRSAELTAGVVGRNPEVLQQVEDIINKWCYPSFLSIAHRLNKEDGVLRQLGPILEGCIDAASPMSFWGSMRMFSIGDWRNDFIYFESSMKSVDERALSATGAFDATREPVADLTWLNASEASSSAHAVVYDANAYDLLMLNVFRMTARMDCLRDWALGFGAETAAIWFGMEKRIRSEVLAAGYEQALVGGSVQRLAQKGWFIQPKMMYGDKGLGLSRRLLGVKDGREGLSQSARFKLTPLAAIEVGMREEIMRHGNADRWEALLSEPDFRKFGESCFLNGESGKWRAASQGWNRKLLGTAEMDWTLYNRVCRENMPAFARAANGLADDEAFFAQVKTYRQEAVRLNLRVTEGLFGAGMLKAADLKTRLTNMIKEELVWYDFSKGKRELPLLGGVAWSYADLQTLADEARSAFIGKCGMKPKVFDKTVLSVVMSETFSKSTFHMDNVLPCAFAAWLGEDERNRLFGFQPKGIQPSAHEWALRRYVSAVCPVLGDGGIYTRRSPWFLGMGTAKPYHARKNKHADISGSVCENISYNDERNLFFVEAALLLQPVFNGLIEGLGGFPESDAEDVFREVTDTFMRLNHVQQDEEGEYEIRWSSLKRFESIAAFEEHLTESFRQLATSVFRYNMNADEGSGLSF